MHYIYDYENSKIKYFIQYLKPNIGNININDLESLEKNDDVVVFYPSQINYMKYGIFPGMDKTRVFGYLEKVRKPFNILQMLETSLIIYRLIRAPERFVFEIDTGNMPRDKALSFVDKMKRKLSVKESFNTDTGQLERNTNIMSLVDNFFLPKSSSGRGSSVSSIGGNVQGFTELDDIYYFQRKLYNALKYPISRIQNRQENRSGDNLFGGSNFGEISRDEVK
jgi:hypothetical protein